MARKNNKEELRAKKPTKKVIDAPTINVQPLPGWRMTRMGTDSTGPMCVCTPFTPIQYDSYDIRRLVVWLVAAAEYIDQKEWEEKSKS